MTWNGRTRCWGLVLHNRKALSPKARTGGVRGGGASGRGCEGSGAPEQAAAGEKPGTEVEAADGGTGAPNGALSGTALGPEPPQDSPEYPRWLAQKAAAAAKASTAPESGGPSGDNTGDNEASEYPERPENWMHSLTLTFCFFGRPAGDDEDKELSTCKEGSGPPNRGAKKNGRRGRKKASTSGSECGSSLGGVSDDESGPENPLHPGAVRQFVGAGESQSRAKVKKETAALMKQQSVDATRAQFVEQSKQQVELSTKMAASIEQVASDVGAQRALVEEDACRKRKKQVIEDLEAELKYCEPHELLGMKSKIRKLLKTPAAQFTKEFVDGGADTPAGPPAPGATPAVVTMPGFTGDSGTTGGATPSEGAVRAV